MSTKLTKDIALALQGSQSIREERKIKHLQYIVKSYTKDTWAGEGG